MSISILGKGWATNHGCEDDKVIDAILRGEAPRLSEIANPFEGKIHHVALVAREDYAEAESFRRVRRSSTITLLALTAAMRAIRESGIAWSEAIAKRTTLLFVSTDGGVAYTRRFYSDIVKNGAPGASPILFPETVYNAPASHLCAYFGIEGDAVTLVGDAGVVGGVMHHAAEILATGDSDYCLVVGAEEMDWILCEAYSTWGQTRDGRRGNDLPGAYFAEGAGALLLARDGGSLLCKTHPGFVFQNPGEAAEHFCNLCTTLTSGTKIRSFISCGNGTEMDAMEAECLHHRFPGVPVYRIKDTLGEALAASSLQQIIFGAHLMEREPHSSEGILVSLLGLTSQAGAVFLTPSGRKG